MYHYFTEKLIDCLLMKCIPVYWGCLNIGNYFNIDGFAVFNSLKELGQYKLSKSFYNDRKHAIEENFKIATKYISSDDYLATKLIKLL
jgi:hypothetical protein